MSNNYTSPLHRIAELELRFRLLFFLDELGLKSTKTIKNDVFKEYLDAVTNMSVGG